MHCRLCEPSHYEYVQHFDKETVRVTQSYCSDTVIEIAEGRYDSSTVLVGKEFDFVPKAEPISSMAKSYLKEKYVCDIGILTTKGHSKVKTILTLIS